MGYHQLVYPALAAQPYPGHVRISAIFAALSCLIGNAGQVMMGALTAGKVQDTHKACITDGAFRSFDDMAMTLPQLLAKKTAELAAITERLAKTDPTDLRANKHATASTLVPISKYLGSN